MSALPAPNVASRCGLDAAARRLVLARVALRVLVLATAALLVRFFPGPARAAGAAALAGVTSLGSPASELAFFGGASAFCAVSPFGYFPAVAAGLAFPLGTAVAVTYASVLLGALLNALLLRFTPAGAALLRARACWAARAARRLQLRQERARERERERERARASELSPPPAPSVAGAQKLPTVGDSDGPHATALVVAAAPAEPAVLAEPVAAATAAAPPDRMSIADALGKALDAQPVAVVALLRLPFLGNGVLNYALSLRTSLPLGPMMAGNALGLALGSVLFPLGGAQLRNLGALLAGAAGDGAQRDLALGTFFGVAALVAASIAGVVTLTRRVLAAAAAKAEAAAAAAAAAQAAPGEEAASGEVVPGEEAALGEASPVVASGAS